MAKTAYKRTAYKELLKILKSKKKTIYARMLHDGCVYIYDNETILASFKYFGGRNIRYLRINTKDYIDRDLFPRMLLDDSCMAGGTELANKLRELFPNANQCNSNMRHAFEFSIIEAALLDPNSCIELSRHTKHTFDVAIVNYDYNISISFRYLYSGTLRYVYLRYNHKKGVKLKHIHIPPYRLNIFNDLLNRTLTPI